ncbi:MAG: nicotinate-nucleotide adenylyltransferase [Chthonomonadales bacterium]
MSKYNVGILGGTFDPIHTAHLVIAEAAQVQQSLDLVLFIPNGHPAHKDESDLTSADDRLEMVRIAIHDYSGFASSRIEIDRDGPSYAIDTLRELVAKNPEAQFWFITGVDTIVEVPGWHEYPKLIKLCNFLVAERPGIESDRALESLPKELRTITEVVDVEPMRISSTEIRSLVKSGGSLNGLVPPLVEKYIKENGLYL